MTDYFDDYEDDRGPEDVPPSEPLGKASVTFDVPMPTVEQVTGQVARQLVSEYSVRYRGSELVNGLGEKIDAEIDHQIGERVGPVIAQLLDQPMQPTDGFGNPVGEKTSLAGLIAHRVNTWAETLVDANGSPSKFNGYGNKPVSRIARVIESAVDHELSKQVKAEVDKIKAQLKASATQTIAKQIADQVAGMVLK